MLTCAVLFVTSWCDSVGVIYKLQTATRLAILACLVVWGAIVAQCNGDS